MDSLRTEEVKRQKTAILKQFGLSEKTDPKTVSAIVKRKLQVRAFINDILMSILFLFSYCTQKFGWGSDEIKVEKI